MTTEHGQKGSHMKHETHDAAADHDAPGDDSGPSGARGGAAARGTTRRARIGPGPGLAALAAVLALGPLAARAQETGVSGTEPVIGGPCEGCEAVFQALPEMLSPRARIAPAGEPGEPMRIVGTVTRADGSPAPGIVVYAYHTDARGIYPEPERPVAPAADRHGRLRGWASTDEEGRYRFDTIRPAGYPDSEIPAHVHMHIIEPGCCTYYLDSIEFEDDPLLTDEEREAHATGRGGSGLVDPRRDDRGVWVVTRDIVLGHRVPGYAETRGTPER